MAPAMQSAEIQFAQRLASSEKGVRDRAVKKLRQYLSARTQKETGGFSQEELLKLWKGLFYCMVVQDEPLLQEELANTISQLIHSVSNTDAQHLFVQTFWQAMNREWPGLDKPQLDTFGMLIRLVLRQSFEVLKQNGWEESQIKLFLDILVKELLCPESQSPDGVRFHFIDIYLDELSTVGGRELLADQNLKFIDPFCKVAAKTKDHTLVQTIAKGVFEVIVDQSALVPEDTVEDQKAKLCDDGLSEDKTSADKMVWEKAVQGEKAALSQCLRHGGGGGGEGDDSAACRDAGSRLQFDYKAVANRLLEMANKKNTPPFNRKRLCKLIRKFQDLSEGCRSQRSFAKDISTYKDAQAPCQGKHKKKRKKLLEKAVSEEKGNKACLGDEGGEGSLQKRKRKRKKRSHFQPETRGPGDAAAPAQSSVGKPGADQGRPPQLCAAEPAAEAAPRSGEGSCVRRSPDTATHSKRKRPRKRSLKAHRGIWKSRSTLENMPDSDLSSGLPQCPAASASPAEGVQVLKKKPKLAALPVNGGDLATLAWPSIQKADPPTSPEEENNVQSTLPQCKRLQKKKAESSSLELHDLSSQKAAILKRRRKKKASGLAEQNGVLGSKAQENRTPSPLKKLRTENDFVKFDTSFLAKPLFFRKAKSTATSPPRPAVQLRKTPPSSKKVTFGLSRNMTAEFRKTDKSILVSPTGLSRVAFNPEQKPLHGVLKTPTRSPASTPLATKKLPAATTPHRRPTAADFF
uniref:ribosomal RNA processing protein 1 homolog B isoform X2 n=1 Tax=Jaculus jaculus TaxID=51337 RepID=UPI001E1B1E27|nr:ribosomal RNA processing protein 1 homolog B isoform X2 [Jaculus jaculus]